MLQLLHVYVTAKELHVSGNHSFSLHYTISLGTCKEGRGLLEQGVTIFTDAYFTTTILPKLLVSLMFGNLLKNAVDGILNWRF